MKYSRKRQLIACGFKSNRGNTIRHSLIAGAKHVGKISRLDAKDFAAVVEDDGESIKTRDADGIPCLTAMFLRPTQSEDDPYNECRPKDDLTADGDMETYFLVHRGKSCMLWNNGFREHQIQAPLCVGDLLYDNATAERRGLCWSIGLKCNTCGFKLAKMSLYEEVDKQGKGRKTAKPNLSVQIALARQGISAHGLSDILSAANIVAPSTRGLQKNANLVCDQIVEENERSMTEYAEDIKMLNVAKGLPYDAPINIEADCRYNNPLSSGGGRTPMQPATQATYLVAEHFTKDKKIIACHSYNKLCKCLDSGGKVHKQTCHANIQIDAVIGQEGLYLKKAVSDLNKKGLIIKHVTIDGDSAANSVAPTIYQSQTAESIKVLRCTRHLTRCLEKEVKKCTFTKTMFDASTQDEVHRLQSRLAYDLGDRCNAEYNQLFKTHRDEMDTLKNRATYIADAILACLQGDCRLCQHYSYVCKGGSRKWKRHYDTREKTVILKPNEAELTALRKCIGIRFAPLALQLTKLNTNSNKVEGSNRGLSKALPKHITWSRNYHGRASAAVNSMNQGPGLSLLNLSNAVGAPLAMKSEVTKHLQDMDRDWKYNKCRKASPGYKKSRAKIRNIKYERYDDKAATMNYSKGMGDACLLNGNVSAKKKNHGKEDHSYVKSM